jgi:zinc and cadmium transporter
LESGVSQAVLLTIYCLMIASAALFGGWLPFLLRLSHTGMQLAMSFVGGTMLGVGILHLLPHAFLELHEIYPCVWWMMGGFLTMFFIERVFHFHHHDVPGAEGESDHAHDHGHDHSGHAHGAAHGSTRPTGWQAALVGLALHSAADGMALAASVAAEADVDAAGFALRGLAVFLVIVLHKPFDSLTLSTLMAVKGESTRARHTVNVLYACAVPLGVVLFTLGIGHAHSPDRQVLGAALAFSAGTFLCISTSDLLPELQFHAHDRLKLSASLLLGLAVAAGIVLIESSTHDHGAHGHGAHEDHAAEPADDHRH